ncbi:MAG: chemotaxis protein CheX [Deltaproteobacteria bacterium]|nr:chemotaxis protein CheX [Deltaproteobacteria bacterium]
MDPELAKPFIKATKDVLVAMANINPTAAKPYVKKDNTAQGDVSAVIGLSGDKNGTFAISFSKKCALHIVKQMLGDAIEDLMNDVQDAVGEISNMISGQARVGLVDLGVTLAGSTPSVIMGDGHTIKHVTKAPVMAIPFSTENGEFTIEFCFE